MKACVILILFGCANGVVAATFFKDRRSAILFLLAAGVAQSLLHSRLTRRRGDKHAL